MLYDGAGSAAKIDFGTISAVPERQETSSLGSNSHDRRELLDRLGMNDRVPIADM